MSKDALAGNVPLRTFGQLKQLWEAKVEPKAEGAPGSGVNTPEPVPGDKQGAVEAPAAVEPGAEASGNATAAPDDIGSPDAST